MAASRISRVLVVLVLVIGAAGVVNADAIFTFDSDPVGTFTTFSDTNSGLTATFSSPVNPGGFAILPTFFITLAGNVLLDPGQLGAPPNPLFPEGVISFQGGPLSSRVLSSLAPDFPLDNVDVATSATSEPVSMTLVGLGLALLGVSARRRRRQAKAGCESKPQ
jgi:hypothetical protein